MQFIRGLGPLELIIILVIVMMVFGVGKLPQVGSAMGKAIREFRKSQSGEEEESAETATANTTNSSVEEKEVPQKTIT